MKLEELKKENTDSEIKSLNESRIKNCLRKNLNDLMNDNSAQGAAEYILLFGGVIAIALAGLLIYKSYFGNNASGLNATQDISSIRANMTNI